MSVRADVFRASQGRMVSNLVAEPRASLAFIDVTVFPREELLESAIKHHLWIFIPVLRRLQVLLAWLPVNSFGLPSNTL